MGCPSPPPGDLPNSGSNPRLLCLLCWQVHSLPLSHLESLNGVTCYWREVGGEWHAKPSHSAKEVRSSHYNGFGPTKLHSPASPNGLGYLVEGKRVLLPRKKVEGSLPTVKLGIRPRARNKGSALYRTARFSQTSVPWTLSSQLFALFIHLPYICIYLYCNFCQISKLPVPLCIWYFFLNYHLLCIVGMKILHHFQRKDNI